MIGWICTTHGIPKIGSPSHRQWIQNRGIWRGVLGHANIADGGFYQTDHGDTLFRRDFILLVVWWYDRLILENSVKVF